MTAVIRASGLAKRFGSTHALKGLDFTIERGCITGLIGPNGAGKTTALKAILGLTAYDGELEVLGLDPYRQRTELMKRVCFIADVAVLPRWLQVEQALDFIAATHPRFRRERAVELLDKTDVTLRHKVKQLSKGMVTQLHLALVMAIDAELLVLDEPTLGLDILFRKNFYEALLGDYFDEGKSILVTTHQVEEIERILTHVLFIDDGRLVLDESMDTVAEKYVEVLVNADQSDAARAMGALHEREVFGKHLFLFEGANRAELQSLGETHTPGIADLFVAKMGKAA
ncbi:MAG: ABC transporter ATP-binding protein [Pseudomonadota bacterium]